MSVTWLDTEKRLLDALGYLSIVAVTEKSEFWVVREADFLDEDDEDELILNISELARALEALGYQITAALP